MTRDFLTLSGSLHPARYLRAATARRAQKERILATFGARELKKLQRN